jgi:fucose permease
VGIYIATMAFLTFPAQKEGEKIDFKNIRKVAFQGNLPWYHASLAFYVAAEIGAGSWLVTYLQQFRAWDIPSSNQALSLFFGSIMAGRLVGGFLVHRIGYLRSVLLAACGAFVFFAAGTLTTYSILIALAGIFLSIIFPTITAAVTDEIHDNHGTVLGALFTFAGLGGMLGPWLVAWVSDLFGLQIGFFLIPFFTAIMIPIFIFIMRGQHGKNP